MKGGVGHSNVIPYLDLVDALVVDWVDTTYLLRLPTDTSHAHVKSCSRRHLITASTPSIKDE